MRSSGTKFGSFIRRFSSGLVSGAAARILELFTGSDRAWRSSAWRALHGPDHP